MKPTNQHAGQVSSIMTYRPLVYGYSNARVRAMRPRLLSKRQAEDLLKINTNAAVAEYLSRTAYGEDFFNLPAKMNDENRVEIAVARNFARVAQKLLKITPNQSRETLQAFLGRYDIHNLKAVLLAKKLGKTKEETEQLLVPAGSLTKAQLMGLFSAKSSEQVYSALRGTEFGAKFLFSASISHIPKDQVKAVLQNPSDTARLDILVAALDSYYYEVASSAVKPTEKDSRIILSLLRSETDAKNAMTILRMKKSGSEKGAILKCMVEGGSFSKSQIAKMASAKDVEQASEIASSFFISETGKDEFTKASERYKKDGQLSHFEVVFEKSIARRSLRALRGSMMSIGTIVGFLFLKEEERNNIRKIVRGKQLMLPKERIEEMLVMVG